jgi:hypothetical protein
MNTEAYGTPLPLLKSIKITYLLDIKHLDTFWAADVAIFRIA